MPSESLETLHDLFVLELRDLYDAENQLIKALPLLAQAAERSGSEEAMSMEPRGSNRLRSGGRRSATGGMGSMRGTMARARSASRGRAGASRRQRSTAQTRR